MPPKKRRTRKETDRATAPAPTPRRNLLNLGLNFFYARRPAQASLRFVALGKGNEVDINAFSTFFSNLDAALFRSRRNERENPYETEKPLSSKAGHRENEPGTAIREALECRKTKRSA